MGAKISEMQEMSSGTRQETKAGSRQEMKAGSRQEMTIDICAKNLHKAFGEKSVLEDFNAVFAKGKWTVLTGPSGCGKTTLLRILMGLEKPDLGTISGMPERFGVLFQEDRLCMGLSALRNCTMIMEEKDSARARKRAQEHLALVGLDQLIDIEKPVRELSGGMRRRVSLVRAVLADTQVLLLDEPFQGLDEGSVQKVIAYLKQYTEGKTVLIVSHEIGALPEEIAVLEMRKEPSR